MRKVLILGLAVLAMSCSRKKCSCGELTNDPVPGYGTLTWNMCSGNPKVFYDLDKEGLKKGDVYCTNERW